MRFKITSINVVYTLANGCTKGVIHDVALPAKDNEVGKVLHQWLVRLDLCSKRFTSGASTDLYAVNGADIAGFVAEVIKPQSLRDINPNRVLVDEDQGVPLSRMESHGIHPDDISTIWVRSDGWMLAAPLHLTISARNLWYREWVGVWNRVEGEDWFEYADLTGENRLADLDAWAADVEAMEGDQ